MGRTTRSDRETGRRKRGGAKLAPSPLERWREKELLLHLGPEGAPWGQPSETRALWTTTSLLKRLIVCTKYTNVSIHAKLCNLPHFPACYPNRVVYIQYCL